MKKETRQFKIILFSGILIFGILALLSLFGRKGAFRLHQVRLQKTTIQEDIRDLKDEEKRLEKAIYALRTDPKTIEKLAREELHLLKQGEVVYQFIEEEDKIGPRPLPPNKIYKKHK
jgi:cell division protein FtsB